MFMRYNLYLCTYLYLILIYLYLANSIRIFKIKISFESHEWVKNISLEMYSSKNDDSRKKIALLFIIYLRKCFMLVI